MEVAPKKPNGAALIGMKSRVISFVQCPEWSAGSGPNSGGFGPHSTARGNYALLD
jgi:hypothetical protein